MGSNAEGALHNGVILNMAIEYVLDDIAHGHVLPHRQAL